MSLFGLFLLFCGLWIFIFWNIHRAIEHDELDDYDD